MLTYNGSEKHLENLAKARLEIGKVKRECPVCKEKFTNNGYERHFSYCKNRQENMKTCPVCSKSFFSKAVTCSRGCANTYFMTGKDHPNYNDENSYRKICFKYHEKKCVCCEEKIIVAVHHLDHNNKNNDPSNLIPLCPTHHQYWHSKHRNLVEPTVREYISNWALKN